MSDNCPHISYSTPPAELSHVVPLWLFSTELL